MGKCGKRLHREWVHVTASGDVSPAGSLREAIRLRDELGGTYEKRSFRK